MTLQQKLNQYIKKYHLSGAETARRIGISPTQVVRIKLHNDYSPAIAEKVYKALGEEYREFVKYSKCPYCGKEYIPRDSRQKTCSSPVCAKKNKIDVTKEYERKVKSGQHVFKTYNERRPATKKYIKLPDANPKQSIPEFMAGKQYGERQREYLLGLQKGQRMSAR